MNMLLSEIFGYILVGSAVILAVWEIRAYRDRHADAWLVTSRRFRRRAVIAVVLGIIGAVIAFEGRNGIPLNRPGPLLAFAAGVTGLSLLLLALAVADVLDTLRSATTQSLRELERSLEPPPDEASDDGGAPRTGQ